MIRRRLLNPGQVFFFSFILFIIVGSGRVFAQQANPTAPQAIITESKQSVCTGKSETFVVNVENIGAYNCQWYVNGIPVPGPNTPIFATNTLNNGDNVNCIVTPVAPGTSPVTSNTIIMKVLPLVVPSINITPANVSICEGTQYNFMADTEHAGINPTIQWYRNGQAVSDTGLTYTANDFANGDQLQCTLINHSDCTNGNMVSSNTSIITVSDNTALTVSIAPGSNGPFCPGEAITFIAATNAPAGSASYQWYVNGQAVGNGAADYTQTFSNGDIVMCKLSSFVAFGCFTNLNAASNPYTVQLQQQHVPTITITQATTGACVGTPVTFNATVTNTGSGAAYQWQVNGANAGDNEDTFTSTSLQNGDTITCILTSSAGGCSVPVTSNTVIAAISPLPIVAFSNSDVAINSGGSTMLFPLITGNIASSRWTPTTGLSDPAVEEPVASPSVTTQYTIHVTTIDGCQASGTITVDVFDQIIIPNTFTPNGDGINDKWDIKGVELFPGCTVEVYSRYGSLVYRSVGYALPWDGKMKGKELPVGTYYYIIDPKNGKPKLSGAVTIVK